MKRRACVSDHQDQVYYAPARHPDAADASLRTYGLRSTWHSRIARIDALGATRGGRGCAIDVDSAARWCGDRRVYPACGSGSQGAVAGGPRGECGTTVNAELIR